MPLLIVIAASGAAQRRLLSEQGKALAASGYSLGRKIQGGTWGDLFSLSETSGLFAEKEYFVVEEAENLGPFPLEYVHAVESGDSATAFVLVYEKIAKGTFSPDLSKRLTAISETPPPFWTDAKVAWLRSKAKDLGIRLDEDAAHLLVEFVENPEELLSEISKIGAYLGDKNITADHVRQFSFDEGRANMLRFVDAFCRAEWRDVLESLPAIRREDSFLPALTALHNRVRLALYQARFPSGAGKLSEALGAKPYQMKMASECLKRYEHSDLLLLSTSLIATSYGEKTGRGTGIAGFESAVLRALATKKKRTAAR